MTERCGAALGQFASADGRPGSTARTLVVSPMVATALMIAVTPGYFDRLTAIPPDWLGIPFGVALVALVNLIALLGAAVVWRLRRSRVTGLMLALTTVPATVIVLLAVPLVYLMTPVRL